MPAPELFHKTTRGMLRLNNPFPPASVPPTALDEQIRRTFRFGRGGTAIKTIGPDPMEFSPIRPRCAVMIGKNADDGCSPCSYVCPEGVIVMQVRPQGNGH